MSRNTEILESIRKIIHRTVATLSAIRDPDARFLGLQSMALCVVHDASQSYGYNEETVSFRPSPKDLALADRVAPWLAWLRRKDPVGFRRLWRWARGTPTWRMAMDEGCTVRTIKNRMDRSLAAIAGHWTTAAVDIIPVHEQKSWKRQTAASFGQACDAHRDAPSWGNPTTVETVAPKKAYVAGVGFVRNGRSLRSAVGRAARANAP